MCEETVRQVDGSQGWQKEEGVELERRERRLGIWQQKYWYSYTDISHSRSPQSSLIAKTHSSRTFDVASASLTCDRPSVIWSYAKGEGVSLMVADFISADYGWLSSPNRTESAFSSVLGRIAMVTSTRMIF
jgi:hypothetical protein